MPATRSREREPLRLRQRHALTTQRTLRRLVRRHDEHALARAHDETPKEASLLPHRLGEDAAQAELSRHLEAEDDAAGRRPGHELDVAAAEVLGDQPTEALRVGGILEDLELLEVGARVASRRELEVPIEDGAGLTQHLQELFTQGDSPCVPSGCTDGSETRPKLENGQ